MKTELEIIAESAIYTVCALAVIVAAVWYGWELRTRLALKLEAFRITNRAWVEFDEVMKAQKSKLPPLRAQLHDIKDRQSEK